ncbi:MAG: ABC transporter substrate-binding protein [Rectinema sp.]
MSKKFIAIFLLLCLAFGAASVGAQAKPKEFKLGFITSLSGQFAAVGETQRMGTQLAVDEVNAKGGLNMPWGKVKVSMLVKDDEAKLDVGVRRYRELVSAGIHAVVGTTWNPMAGAINEETKITPMPYLASCVPALDSFRKGNPAEGTFSVAFTPWSIGYLSGASIVNQLGKKKIFFVSRADSWGKTIYEGLQAALKEYGGEVVGFAEYPQGNVDFSSAINQAKSIKPDIFVACQFAGDAIALYKQAYDMGLYSVTTMFNTWITNVVAKGIPDNALKDLYALTFSYYNMEGFADKAVAASMKQFADAHIKAFGEPPDAYGTIAYIAAKMIFEAAEKTQTFDASTISKYIQTNSFQTVKGPGTFRVDRELVGKYMAFVVKGKPSSERKDPQDVFKIMGYFGGDSALPSLSSLGY